MEDEYQFLFDCSAHSSIRARHTKSFQHTCNYEAAADAVVVTLGAVFLSDAPTR